MKTIAFWLEFRFNLFLVPFEDWKHEIITLPFKNKFQWNTPPPPPNPPTPTTHHPPPHPTPPPPHPPPPPPHNKNMAHIAMSAV